MQSFSVHEGGRLPDDDQTERRVKASDWAQRQARSPGHNVKQTRVADLTDSLYTRAKSAAAGRRPNYRAQNSIWLNHDYFSTLLPTLHHYCTCPAHGFGNNHGAKTIPLPPSRLYAIHVLPLLHF